MIEMKWKVGWNEGWQLGCKDEWDGKCKVGWNEGWQLGCKDEWDGKWKEEWNEGWQLGCMQKDVGEWNEGWQQGCKDEWENESLKIIMSRSGSKKFRSFVVYRSEGIIFDLDNWLILGFL